MMKLLLLVEGKKKNVLVTHKKILKTDKKKSSSNPAEFFVGTLKDKKYNSIISNLEQGTKINQLVFVPILSDSEERYPAGTPNMLLAVGTLIIQKFGNASAALYDGTAWHPYLLTTQINGQQGTIQKLIHLTDFDGLKEGPRK